MNEPIEISNTGLVKLLIEADWKELPQEQQDCGVCYLTSEFGTSACKLYACKAGDPKCVYQYVIDNDMQKFRQQNPYLTFGLMAPKLGLVLDMYKLSTEETQTALAAVSDDDWEEYTR